MDPKIEKLALEKPFREIGILKDLIEITHNYVSQIEGIIAKEAGIIPADYTIFLRKEYGPIAKAIESTLSMLFVSSTEETRRIRGYRISPNFQQIMQSAFAMVPSKDKITEEEYLERILEEDYSFLINELGRIDPENPESSFITANLLEKAMNISKLLMDDPLDSRKIEDFQWDLIQIKRILIQLAKPYLSSVESDKAELNNLLQQLNEKMMASQKTKQILEKLGLESVLKGGKIKRLPDGRVEYIWRKSG